MVLVETKVKQYRFNPNLTVVELLRLVCEKRFSGSD